MSLLRNALGKGLAMLVLALAFAAPAAHARPGCVGKMWNPLTDLDFRLMGGIKVVGFSLMQAPSSLGEPPNHHVPAICFCKDGLQTGFGLGMTFWTPSYINDMARQAGCMGFLDGINILPGFMSLSSSQEYNFHDARRDGTTNMQIHWAYADITAILGKQLFEKCHMTTGSMTISYLTEPDFVFQNDVYSIIMTPQAALLAESPLLAQMACGAESIANTLGDWQDWGVCGWKGARMPMDGITIAKDSAQVSNMDITIKYLARSALLGTTMRTMGDDVVCAPTYSPFYDPFQNRFQWAYPGKVSTRYNVDVMRWGMFIRDNGQGSMVSLTNQAAQMGGVDANLTVGSAIPGNNTTGNAPTSQVLSTAQQIVNNLPKPLNYPTKEAGYMEVWEARECCLVVLTIENVIKMVVEQILGSSADLQQIQELFDLYNQVTQVVSFVKDPIGGVMNLIGQGITDAIGSAADGIGQSLGNLVGGK